MRTLFLCAMLVAAPAFAQKMPPGSFLTKPATNLSELQTDALVVPALGRYEFFYGITKRELAAGLQLLRLVRSSEGKRTKVWYCRPGHFGSASRWVPKGTLVWVWPSGEWAFLASCGNPVSKTWPTFPSSPSVVVPVSEPVETLRPTEAKTTVAPLSLTATEPKLPGLSTDAFAPVTPSVPGIKPEYGAVVTAALFFSGSGNTQVVPEPGTLTVFAVLTGSLLAGRRRSK
ncbi:MAG: hypothetical protein JSS66_06345 [Armatimonadetes bacterium]|nr:hypothetical protein [Armatimonadota bacterium]